MPYWFPSMDYKDNEDNEKQVAKGVCVFAVGIIAGIVALFVAILLRIEYCF